MESQISHKNVFQQQPLTIEAAKVMCPTFLCMSYH